MISMKPGVYFLTTGAGLSYDCNIEWLEVMCSVINDNKNVDVLPTSLH